jgi:hypothetical protein
MRNWYALAPLLAVSWLVACSNPGEAACERVVESCAGIGAPFLPNCREAAAAAASYNPACEKAVDDYAECLDKAIDKAEDAASSGDKKNGPGTFGGKFSCDLSVCADKAAQVQACAEEARKSGSTTGAGGASATSTTTTGAGGAGTTTSSTTSASTGGSTTATTVTSGAGGGGGAGGASATSTTGAGGAGGGA